MDEDNIMDNVLKYRESYNTYYIFQNSSGNPSGNYHIDPYIVRDSIIVSNENLDNKSSAWNFEV